MFKITKTDHGQQSLVLFSRTKVLVREGLEAILDNPRLDSLLRDDALQLKRHLEDQENEDKPVLFTKSHGSMKNCTECLGTGTVKQLSDANKELEFEKCPICKGEGQLYYEMIRKYYVPTEYHRRKLTK